MALEIEINDSPRPETRYITYAPAPCRIRQVSGTSPLAVTLTSKAARPGGGEAEFYAARTIGATPAATLAVTLPANGNWVEFGLAGKFGKPSVEDRDCLLIASSASANAEVPLMVRVRKNANQLQVPERDRFLVALARFNSAVAPAVSGYQTLRSMHVGAANGEEHGGPQFLPWHRSYLLDLERQLQAIDASVALHYWRFDQPAPNVFTRGFMGETRRHPTTASAVTLDSTNPLVAWVTDSVQGISRSSTFDTLNEAARGAPGFPVLTQAQTLALGDNYPSFSTMEDSPHAAAHVSFNGYIANIATAPRDPLFFMLHSNVDRLWAMWQWINRRTDGSDPRVYAGQNRDGRRLGDTMWPWNRVVTPPRPNFAPGNGLPSSPMTTTPGSRPAVADTIDYHGSRVGSPGSWLGFSYDDVPFEFTA